MFILSQDKKIMVNSDMIFRFSIERFHTERFIFVNYPEVETYGRSLGSYESEEIAEFVLEHKIFWDLCHKFDGLIMPSNEEAKEEFAKKKAEAK